jgi:adenosylcobinamide-GDP ribazoletransferase
MAGAWFGFSLIFPPTLAIILALLIRILLTGALHEDGLADFFDGFGGGRTKTDILRIMKDSHIGSYALIGMLFYYLITINTLLVIPHELIAIVLLVADPLAKFCSTILMNLLPYARNESESKSKTLFEKMNSMRFIVAAIVGMLPAVYFIDKTLWLSLLVPFIIMILIFFYSKNKIGGYTGDLCGTTALLCELAFYISIYLSITVRI